MKIVSFPIHIMLLYIGQLSVYATLEPTCYWQYTILGSD